MRRDKASTWYIFWRMSRFAHIDYTKFYDEMLKIQKILEHHVFLCSKYKHNIWSLKFS